MSNDTFRMGGDSRRDLQLREACITESYYRRVQELSTDSSLALIRSTSNDWSRLLACKRAAAPVFSSATSTPAASMLPFVPDKDISCPVGYRRTNPHIVASPNPSSSPAALATPSLAVKPTKAVSCEMCNYADDGHGPDKIFRRQLTAATHCTECSVGQYSTGNTLLTTCANCDAGKYTAGAGSSVCDACAVGRSFSGSAASFNCPQCPAGQYMSSAGTTVPCPVCPDGTFSAAGASVCSRCTTAGKYCTRHSTNLGATTTSNVATGYYGTPEANGGSTGYSGQASCEAAHACTGGKRTKCSGGNSYQDETGQTTCKSCPSTNHAVSADRKACTALACPVGQERSAGVCTDCFPGKEKPKAADMSCNMCADDYYKTNRGIHNCLPHVTSCPAGKYMANNVVSAIATRICKDCSSETFTKGSTNTANSCLAHSSNQCVAGKFWGGNPLSTTVTYQCSSCTNFGADEYFRSEPAHSFTNCAKKRLCQAGEKMTDPGSILADRVCEECEQGKFMELPVMIPGHKAIECVDCPQGRYGTGFKPVSKEEGCHMCQEGTDTGGEVATSTPDGCQPCRPGTYKSHELSICTACSVGYFQPEEHSINCHPCPAGFQGIPAPAGEGQLQLTEACIQCSGNTISPDAGSINCTPCKDGYWPDNLHTTCKACDAGKRQMSSGCENCPNGHYSSAGSTECTGCPSGRFSASWETTAEDCDLCPAGKIGKGTGKDSEDAGCVLCGDGDWSSAGDLSCYWCTEGRKWTSTGCEACGIGKYQNAIRQLGCKNCPEGRFTAGIGSKASSDCAHCPPGRYTSSTSSPYVVYAGQSSCADCLAGRFRASSSDPECEQCPTGQYQHSTGSIGCRSCPVGHVIDYLGADSIADCDPCVAGRFQTALGKSVCETCIEGFVQPGSGKTTCTECGPGKKAPSEGAAFCSSCDAGYYSTGDANVVCTICPIGRFQSEPGKSECELCPAGKFRDTAIPSHKADGSQCFNCPAGHFTASIGLHASCDPCEASKVQPSEGATGCNACNWGKFMDVPAQLACKPCPAGKYEDSTGDTAVVECKDCREGHKCPSTQMTADVPCPLGWLQPAPGQQVCQQCSAGNIAPEIGRSICDQCDRGLYQGSSGESVCNSCLPGKLTPSLGMTVCDLCAVGLYNDASGKSLCSSCDVGRFADTSGTVSCKLCMQGRHQDETAKAVCKACAHGKFSVDPNPAVAATYNAECKQCAPGTIAASAALSTCTQCASGLYVTEAGASSCAKCQYGTFAANKGQSECQTCVAGRYSSSLGMSICTACPHGHYSLDAAGGDLSKFYRNMYCVPCPPGTLSSGLIQTNVDLLQAAFAAGEAPGDNLLQLLSFESATHPDAFPSESNSAAVATSLAASAEPPYAFIRRMPVEREAVYAKAAFSSSDMSKAMFALVSGEGCMMNTPGSSQSVYAGNQVPCGSGRYQNGHGHAKCKQCGLGKYAAPKSIEGVERPTSMGATHCWDCPTGRFGPKYGQESCPLCPVGFIAPDAGADQCTACVAGKYASSPGGAACSRCHEGRFTRIAGQSVCTQCRHGTYMDASMVAAGVLTCALCPEGRIAASVEAAVCTHCPDGTTAFGKGRSACDQCAPGRYVQQRSLMGTGASVCLQCDRGHFAASPGATACTAAPAGKYVLFMGQTHAEQCAPGSYTAAGQDAATGPYSPDATGAEIVARCRLCPAGKYCPNRGHSDPASAPLSCRAGRWGVAGMQHADCSGPCPAGFRCPEGTAEGDKLSNPCGAGRICPEGTASTGIAIPDGHYGTQPQSTLAEHVLTTSIGFARCEAGHYCASGVRYACPAGTWQPHFGKTARSDCTARECTAGFFCPEGSIMDAVEACAPLEAANPAMYYCLRGTATRRLATNYGSTTLRGEFTPSHQLAINRESAQACPENSACWYGKQYLQLEFTKATCAGGIRRLSLVSSASSTDVAKSAAVPSLGAVALEVVSYATMPPGIVPATSLATSMRSFAAPPGCVAENPFGILSSGQVQAVAGATTSPLECLAVKAQVLVQHGSAQATCTLLGASMAMPTSMSPSIALGTDHACYLRAAHADVPLGGDVACFSSATDPINRAMATSETADGVLQVVVGGTHTCALHSSGTVHCAGVAKGRGIGTEHIWNAVDKDSQRFVGIAATDDFTCGISAGTVQGDTLKGRGLLVCKGGNPRLLGAYNQLASIWTTEPVVMVSLGSSTGCAVLASTGRLVCFSAVSGAEPPTGVFQAVAVGEDDNACALRGSAAVCWGHLWNGVAEVSAHSYKAVAHGREWVCMIQGDTGYLQCFGVYVPALFPSLEDLPSDPVAQITARGDTLCVVFESGAPACYGAAAKRPGSHLSLISTPGQPLAIPASL